MESNIIKIGEPTEPRFEFRTFGHNFTDYHEEMAKLSTPVTDGLRVRIFDEIYVLSKKNHDINVKIRSNLLDVKKIIQKKNNLEQWNTIIKYDFPVAVSLILDEIFPMLNTDIKITSKDNLSKKQFISIVKQSKDLLVVPIHKKRHGYIVYNTICEFAELTIGDENLFTVSVESTNANEVIKTINLLKLNSFENINYVQVIKRINGIISKPFAN